MTEQLALDLTTKRTIGAEIGQRIKERALSAGEFDHKRHLEMARLIRDRIALERGTVDADAIHEVFDRQFSVDQWGPFTGAIFRDGLYEPIGWKASTFAANHGRAIRVWRRKPITEATK